MNENEQNVLTRPLSVASSRMANLAVRKAWTRGSRAGQM